jgi:hypothetical protein
MSWRFIFLLKLTGASWTVQQGQGREEGRKAHMKYMQVSFITTPT